MAMDKAQVFSDAECRKFNKMHARFDVGPEKYGREK